MPDITMADILALSLAVALNAYVVFGGADFGGGVWDLLAAGPRRDRQRALIAKVLAPIWEANHVWLILAVVLLFTCFPPAFARIGTVLHIPLTLMLIGIVLRGSAFVFRAYDTERDAAQRRWGRTFAMASLLTPLLFGVTIGAVVAGRVGPVDRSGFAAGFVAPWLTWFSGAVGMLTLAMFALLAAVFLTVEADTPELREDFRRRAIGTGIVVLLAAALVLGLALTAAPHIARGLTQSQWAIPWHAGTALAAAGVFAALYYRRWHLARIGVVLQVSLIFWGWPIAQYPYLIPPDLTIQATAAPAVTLRLVAIALVIGAAVLLPSLLYLFRIFNAASRPPRPPDMSP